MTHIKQVEFDRDYLLIRYRDDEDPPWSAGRELAVNWRKDSHVERLAHVAYHVFYLFVTNPDGVAKNDEILQEWIGKLLHEQPGADHEFP